MDTNSLIELTKSLTLHKILKQNLHGLEQKLKQENSSNFAQVIETLAKMIELQEKQIQDINKLKEEVSDAVL